MPQLDHEGGKVCGQVPRREATIWTCATRGSSRPTGVSNPMHRGLSCGYLPPFVGIRVGAFGDTGLAQMPPILPATRPRVESAEVWTKES